MLLSTLLRTLSAGSFSANADAEILGICEDSRTVQPGWLFIARSGTKADGKQFIRAALERGAAAVVTDDASVTAAVPVVLVPVVLVPVVLVQDIALATALLASAWCNHPAQHLHIAAVTGTNGKTTVSWLVYQLLRAMRLQGNSIGCGLIGTVAIDDGAGLREASMTTPPALELAQSFARMQHAGYRAASMEVSSHALHQKRTDALRFAAAIFTNLTGDHLDYHGTMDHYAAAKARLFELLADDGVAIINVGGAGHERMLQACAQRGVRPLRVVALTQAEAQAQAQSTLAEAPHIDARIIVHAQSLAGIDAEIFSPFGSPARVRVPLVGTFNAINLLQALLAAHALAIKCGIESSLAWQKLLAEVPSLTAPPGRLERVTAPHAPFGVFVDYAHSDDSLASVLRATRASMSSSPVPGAHSTVPCLHCVFGCGGDRDRTKRPRMGLAAAQLADRVVVTSDNPRTEDPSAIVQEVFAGVPANLASKVHCEVLRAKAIQHAINTAREGDVVIIAGKGHETYQILPDGKGGTVRTDFDDRAVARAALQARGIATLSSSLALQASVIEPKLTPAPVTTSVEVAVAKC